MGCCRSRLARSLPTTAEASPDKDIATLGLKLYYSRLGMQTMGPPPLSRAAQAAAAAQSLGVGGFTFLVEPGVAPSGPGSYGRNLSRMMEPDTPDKLSQAWSRLGKLEAMSPAPRGTVATFTKQNLFVKAVHAAFYDHHPLVLSPDVIWLTIAQGLAHHVAQNAEALRHRFVSHEGKRELVISRPDFVKGSPSNDWEGVFPEFSRLIKENSREGVVELVENDFTTTGPVERIVSQVTLMDAVQHYFSYTVCGGCGFPSITLTGAVEDWEKIRSKAEQLRDYDLDWWLEALLPALDQFVAAAKGHPDLDFWRSLCMINTGSSFPAYSPLTGWVQVFFPYIKKPSVDRGSGMQLKRNENLAEYLTSVRSRKNLAKLGEGERSKLPSGVGRGVDLELFPPAMSSAPFTYKDAATGIAYKMGFFGGVTCLVQHPEGAIEPKLGWAVLESPGAA